MKNLEIITRAEAKQINQKWYYLGIACKNGHVDKRYTNTGICYACKREQNKCSNKRNNDNFKKRHKKNYQKHKESIKKRNKIWVENNKEKSNKIKNKWKVVHREQYLAQAREYARNKRNDPYYRLSKNMSKAIWECLKNNKKQLNWLQFVDYSLDELIKHLESKFTTEMNWKNYGIYWHVDHIKPLSWFDLSVEFKEAWALSNLQPLEAKINLSKNNRYIG